VRGQGEEGKVFEPRWTQKLEGIDLRRLKNLHGSSTPSLKIEGAKRTARTFLSKKRIVFLLYLILTAPRLVGCTYFDEDDPDASFSPSSFLLQRILLFKVFVPNTGGASQPRGKEQDSGVTYTRNAWAPGQDNERGRKKPRGCDWCWRPADYYYAQSTWV